MSPTDGPRETTGALVSGMRVARRYELQRELGRGGMGVVWLAIDHTLQRQIAFKVLPDVLREDRTALMDLRDETRRNLEITHPHIVRIYDFEEDVGIAGLTMEFVDGETLAAKKVNRPQRIFEALEILPWIRQLCEALHYAHTDPRVVHRDLKPANLMVNARGQIKITDFGIARSICDSITRVSNAQPSSGTLSYMSPQQLMGSSSASDDIYSIGATLYDMLTSKPPFHTGNISAQILQMAPPSMTERRAQLGREGGPIPEAFEEVIAACLAKDPKDRPASALALIERLETRLGGSRRAAPPLPPELETNTAVSPPIPPIPQTQNPIPAAIPTPTSTSPANPSRSPWLIVALFVGVGLLALAGGGYLGLRSTRRPAPTPPPIVVEPGRVMVNTIPSGARVFLDGREVGASPMTIGNVGPGDHLIRMEADEYQPLDISVAVHSGETVDRGPVSLIPIKRPDPEIRIVQAPTPIPTPEVRPPVSPQVERGLSDQTVRDVIRQYLTATDEDDNAAVVACYAQGVDFFDEGSLSTAQLRRSLDSFRAQWPVFDIAGMSEIEVIPTSDPDVKIAQYTYRFVARNGAKTSEGTAHDSITVKRFGDRALIIRTRQNVTDRARNYK